MVTAIVSLMNVEIFHVHLVLISAQDIAQSAPNIVLKIARMLRLTLLQLLWIHDAGNTLQKDLSMILGRDAPIATHCLAILELDNVQNIVFIHAPDIALFTDVAELRVNIQTYVVLIAPHLSVNTAICQIVLLNHTDPYVQNVGWDGIKYLSVERYLVF